MYIKRKKVLGHPNQNFPGTWIFCILLGIISLIFAYGFFSLNGYWWSPLVGIGFGIIAINYFLQAYAWYRDIDEVKKFNRLDAHKQAVENRQLAEDIKGLFSRKQK